MEAIQRQAMLLSKLNKVLQTFLFNKFPKAIILNRIEDVLYCWSKFLSVPENQISVMS